MIPGKIIRSMLRPISQPVLCNYYITTKCNAKCIFCNIHRQKGIHANYDDVIENLHGLHRMGVRFIDFTGGEPLMHPRIQHVLTEADKLGFITTVTTNTLEYPSRAGDIAGLVDLLHFSLDSMDREQHNKLRGVPCFDSVMESIDIALSLGEKPDILFTVSSINIDQLEHMITFAQQKRLVLIINPVFSYYGNNQAENRVLQMVLAASRRSYVYVNSGIVRFMAAGGNSIQNPRCKAVTTAIAVSPDNCLYMPCFHKHTAMIPVTGSIEQTFDSPEVESYAKKQGTFTFCDSCAISCYLDSSFTIGKDSFSLSSGLSKIRYTWYKYFR